MFNVNPLLAILVAISSLIVKLSEEKSPLIIRWRNLHSKNTHKKVYLWLSPKCSIQFLLNIFLLQYFLQSIFLKTAALHEPFVTS